MSVIQKVTRIFKKLMEIMAKVRKSLTELSTKYFRHLTHEARHAGEGRKFFKHKKWDDLRETARTAQGKGIRDFRPGAPGETGKKPWQETGKNALKAGAVKSGGGFAQDTQDSDGKPIGNPDSAEINRLLNPND